MPRVDGSLGSLVQGVSQQPDRARRPGQAKEQRNVRNDEVFGLSRRSPTQYVGALSGLTADTVWDNSEQGFVSDNTGQLLFWYADGTTLKLFDPTDGSEVGSMSSSYLPAVSKGNVEVVSIDGEIMVLNKTKTVAMDTGVSQDYAPKDLGTIVYARGGESGTRFSITVKDSRGQMDVAITTSNTDPDEITPGYIIEQLRGLLVGDYTMATSALHESVKTASFVWSTFYEAIVYSDHLLIRPTGAAGLDPEIVVRDGSGKRLLVGVLDSVDEVGKLPLRARKNQVVKVKGAAAGEDDYYLRFDVDNAFATDTYFDIEGTWVEDSAHDTNFRIDDTTMPHYIDTTSGYTLSPFTWTDKFAGDDESNPDPTFVGDTISDMIEFQERLVFLHDRQITMSQAQDVSNFFLQTATALLDDDTINIVPTSGRKSNTMRHAVNSNRDLVIFADDDAQFTVTGRAKLTPETASAALTAEFSMNVGMKPVPAGNVIFYGAVVGNHIELSEMFLQGQDDVHERRSVSNHVPRYIDGNADTILADDGNSFALVWDSTALNGTEVYLYEYLWQDNTRLQSAWSVWDFQDRLIAAHVQGATVTCVFYQDANLPAFVVTIDLARNDSSGLPVEVHLDRLQAVTGTSITLPKLPTGREYVLVHGAGNDPEGLLGTMTQTADNGTTIDYTIGAGSFLVGTDYKTRFVPTMPVVKDASGTARAKTDLAVARFKIVTENTGPFNVIRETPYEDAADYWTLVWEGFRWDDPDFQLGAIPVDSGEVEFPFEENAATSQLVIETSSYLPMTITEIEWEGSLRGRSTRINTGG